jgi:hypothetical protein
MAGQWFALPKLFKASKNEGYEIVKQWSPLPKQARVRPKSLPDSRVARWLDGLDELDDHFR